MKYFLTIAIFLILSSPKAYAKCGGSGIYVAYPSPNDKISTGAVVILQAFGTSRKSLYNFGSKSSIFLQCKNEKIRLIREEVYEGDYNWSQALFRAEKLLSEGEVYTLVFENVNAPKNASIPRNSTKWVAEKITRNGRIDLRNKIQNNDTEWLRMGCGPAVYSVFSINTNNLRPTVIEVEIKNICTGEASIFNVITKDNKLKIGHGMCGGPFVFARNDEYKIRFKNNMQANSDSWTNWIPCQNPANNPFNKK